MMEICEDGHEQIVWVRTRRIDDCPVCEVKKELAEANEKIAELEKQIEDLEAQ